MFDLSFFSPLFFCEHLSQITNRSGPFLHSNVCIVVCLFISTQLIFTLCVSIIDIFGPYQATDNDATIIMNLFDSNDLSHIFKRGDVFILDRGFRDAVQFLENKGFVKMPKLLNTKVERQFKTKDANESRVVTKGRYVVEVRNGTMKEFWHLFNQIWDTYSIEHFHDDFLIGAAIINAFLKKVVSDKNDSENITNRMLQSIDKPNILKNIVGSRSFELNLPKFQAVTFDRNGESSIPDFYFPRLTVEDLKQISLGTYHIKNAASYYAHHIRDRDNEFLIFVRTFAANS